tara:strand:+ start:598 stop:861 length:264 start_codon:yes stop_codon:yes gene_type:complete
MKPLIKDPKKRAKAKKALRVGLAIGTGGQSEVARLKGKAIQGAVNKIAGKKDGGMMKYKDGGSVSSKKSSSRKGCGAAKRGFGKALK